MSTTADPRISVASLLTTDHIAMDLPSRRANPDEKDSLTSYGDGDVPDEDVLMAVRALGDMRSRAVAGPPTLHISPYSNNPGLSNSTSPSASTSTSSDTSSIRNEERNPDFVTRVSGLPLVNTVLSAYEQSKAGSRLVKYSAEMVESSVISMTRPVMHHLPVDQLDEFACRQLDRFGRGKGTEDSTLRLRANRGSLRERDGETRREDDADGPGSSSDALHAGVSRSTWQTMLFEAGGIGAAVSEESMRRLKYCLHWLQFATARIDQQIIILRDFIANMHPPNSDTPSTNETISSSHLQTLQEVKKEVVQTIRQVIDVVSKYAGGALPEPARVTVRNFILHLPQRWASAAQEMVEPSPRPIRGRRPRGSRQNSRHYIESAASSSSTRPTQDDACTTASAADQAAKKILTLATESLDMLRNVTAVFKESLDRADAWVERLRVIGIQRQQSDAIDVGVPSQALDDDAHSSIHKRLGSSSTVSSYYATPSASLSSPPPDTPSVASPDLYPRSLADEDHSDSADSEDEARPRKALKLDLHG